MRLRSSSLLPALGLATALQLGGCALPANPPPAANRSAMPSEQAVTQAATAPLSDLNLVQAEIPPLLRQVQKNPYAAPEDDSCRGLTAEVMALDAVLGEDLDSPPNPNRPNLLERGAGAVGEAAVGAVRSTTESVIPFRSWVRKLTGAERYSREVIAALAAGTARRSFLKGLGLAGNCTPPAAPRR